MKAVAFLCIVIITVACLLLWRDYRVNAVLSNTAPGSQVAVGTDVCEALKDRGAVREGQHCGYGQTVMVKLIAPRPIPPRGGD